MFDMYESYFKYAGVNSKIHKLIIANVETSRFQELRADAQSVTIFNRRNKKKYIIGDDYSEATITFDMDIIREDESVIPDRELHDIEKWLFCQSTYQKMFLYQGLACSGETPAELVYLNCRFTHPKKLEYNGGIVGFAVTVEADSNMLYFPRHYEFDLTQSGTENNILIRADSDWSEYIYPRVSFTLKPNESAVVIRNLSDDAARETKFVTMGAYSTVYMDGEINYINSPFFPFFVGGRNFIRLLDGENKLAIQGDLSKITFDFEDRRFL